ncbi:hypothetical protein OJF2_10230 [Aquisphaera giovannonii]|uniref:DUF1501 domain-containing protein n=1 Tax=Aquisphaera giovannonii TaxID=406548 RepID=A0A5B9VVR7_9BACT|nr:DUF1501 domain-containing protein [Aquisphaera giovannonii]QEH32546.1 hypothetical protein OJF2_10230 [Aquisphaera giovannonii]
MTDESSIVRVGMNGQGVVSRRGFIRTMSWGAAGLGAAAGAGVIPATFTDLMVLKADELRKRQMACILLWMAGGPSQLETFDPKPGTEHGGTTKAIETSVPGISIAEGWNQTAKVMKEIALVRSMTNREANHQRASYQLHTGYAPSATIKHPHLGCSVAAQLGESKFDLPHIVSIGGATAGAGFLGASLEPFVIQNAERPPDNTQPRVAVDRFKRRLGLLNNLEVAGFGTNGGADRVKEHRAVYTQTARMVLSPEMKAFDLEGESPALRDAYGRTAFGQGCLLARRLVQAGVTFVEVRSNGWDTHQEVNDRVGKLAGQVDPAFATLIRDLKEHGMLGRTLVVWMGEFGRTPKINANAGRDHFPRVFNVALAGGGVRGGQVIGASNADGTDVKDRPVSVPDLMASLCHGLGVNAQKEVDTPIGRPIKVVDGGKAVAELFG